VRVFFNLQQPGFHVNMCFAILQKMLNHLAKIFVPTTFTEPFCPPCRALCRLRHPPTMTLRQQLESVEGRGLMVRWWNVVMLGTAAICLVVLVASWAIAINSEGGQMKRRHGASIFAFILALLTIALNVASLRVTPRKALYIAVQISAILTMMLTGISGGMTAIVVDLCTHDENEAVVHCGAHYAEYTACWFVCFAMGSIFATTQQNVVVLVDHGVLSGIGSRMARIDG
jgi:lysylphosphatidylglycerol synthetase-like protein (DUF2156 family)